jgi:hypothetical protein
MDQKLRLDQPVNELTQKLLRITFVIIFVLFLGYNSLVMRAVRTDSELITDKVGIHDSVFQSYFFRTQNLWYRDNLWARDVL